MRLRKIRKSMGMSQYALAAKANVSREYIRLLEAGHSDPTAGMLKRLAKALRVPVTELLAVTDTPITPEAGSLGLTGYRPLRFTGPLEAIAALHRYFIWADRMRSHFFELSAAADAREKAGQPVSIEERLFTYPYMSYWYAAIYVVIEGWRVRLRLRDPAINKLLRSPNVAKIEQHRHGTFHFHPKYFDAKLLAFTTSSDWVVWIEQLHEEFGRWFLEYFRQLDSEEGNPNA